MLKNYDIKMNSNERKGCFMSSMVQFSQTFGLFENELLEQNIER